MRSPRTWRPERRPTTGFMVYLLIDPRDKVPFYAGMTARPGRRWGSHNSDGIACPRVREIRQLGLKCHVRLVAVGLSIEEARVRERAVIVQHWPTLLNQDPYGRPRDASRPPRIFVSNEQAKA